MKAFFWAGEALSVMIGCYWLTQNNMSTATYFLVGAVYWKLYSKDYK